MTTVNSYQITITQSPPQIIEPMVDILHKDIFNRTKNSSSLEEEHTLLIGKLLIRRYKIILLFKKF